MVDISGLTEGDPLLLVQTRFTLPEPAIFLRYYPRGSDCIAETAVFLRTGTVCPVSKWARFLCPRDMDRTEYEHLVKMWARGKTCRRILTPTLLDYFEEIKDYDTWRDEWIISGKLYRNYDHANAFDNDDPRKKSVDVVLQSKQFLESTDLIVGCMDKIVDKAIDEACETGPHAVVELVKGRKWFSNECGGKKAIDGFIRDFADAKQGKQEGQWVNLVIKKNALSSFGLPQTFLASEGHKTYPVPNYDQLILHCDGTDKARTLGMHRDVFPGCSDTPVSTILGCVGGLGKEILIWRGDPSAFPAWWSKEGLPCELFDYVYKNTGTDLVQRIVLKPGQYIFMPRGLWHWVRPIPGARWTVMVTSSFHTCGHAFDSACTSPCDVVVSPRKVNTPKSRKRVKSAASSNAAARRRPLRRCRVV